MTERLSYTKGGQLDTDATGQLGVNIVERLVLQHGWVFRPQYVSDQGIDAQVETKEAGVTTGRLLALQIKAWPIASSRGATHRQGMASPLRLWR